IPAPVEFLQTVRRVTKELGIPLILDEIQCGMGRSGKMFAFEYADIIPDVVLISKAIGGSQPMAVVVYNKELDKWTPGAHAGTFRGNQLAMKAGTVVLNRVSKPDFLADVTRKGDLIRKNLNELKTKVSIIGDVRGKGLMVGTEFVDPRGTKDCIGSLPASGEIAGKVQKYCFEHGLIVEKGGRNGSVMRCLCALNITDEDLNKAWTIFKEAVLAVNKEYN
nr:aminotransferase class III-fold pyridoxal phosphate-dependent enzyme [Treponema sp.]